MDKFIRVLFILVTTKLSICDIGKGSSSGPTLTVEPQARIDFSNTAGTELRCTADGHPAPKVTWVTREGALAEDISGLRYQRNHKDVGSLVFPPFSRPEYRQEIHDAIYQCVASNDFGTVISREIHIRGVVKQRFTQQVYDEFVTRGNTAVLKCHLPTLAKEHSQVDAWLRSDGHVLKNTFEDQNRGKPYSVLLSGELLIRDVREKDSEWSYRCQTRNRLTGEMVISDNQGKVIITEPHVSTLPRITFNKPQVRAEERSVAQLPCVAQGNPPPTYKWMKDVSGLLRPVEPNNRIWISQGVLTIQRVTKQDGGQYQCIARNSIGERRLQTHLIVDAPLSVTLHPEQVDLAVGQETTFSCNITGYPVQQVFWLKDRRPVLATDTRVRLLSRDVLHISGLRREDRGMYQCFAQNDKDSAQGAAELNIADAPPSLISVFPDLTVHPSERVSLKCVSMGNPIPKITWLLDEEIVSKIPRISTDYFHTAPNGHIVSFLNISAARTEDSGEYSCQATNDVGSASHSARLNVHGPLFVRSMRNTTAISGKQLSLRCPYGGYPVEKLRWFKEDQLLPLEPRQKVTQTGSLIIQYIQRSSDQARYRCEVQSADGQISSGTTFVSVVVAPEINAILLPETITMDEENRAKLVCVVIKGDTPLRFQWLKNDLPFLAHGDATVHTFEDSSIITIKKVSSGDRGRYTCVATNIASSNNSRTVHLIVNVPPQWTVEPSNATVILGKTVWIDCAAKGFPLPTILWKKLIYTNSGGSGDFTWVHSSPGAHRFNNGTLKLTDVEEGDAGSYLCQAQNGIGTGLSKIITLKVRVPPRIAESYESLTIVEGNNVTLSCLVEGDAPIEVYWKRNHSILEDKRTHRYSASQSLGDDDQTMSELRLYSISRVEDSGTYTCTATSDIGSDVGQRHLIIQGRPDPPNQLKVENLTSRTVTISWKIEHDGNSPVTAGIVQYNLDSGKDWTNGKLIVSGSDATATLRQLNPVTTYFVRVLVENALGRSKPSNIINVTTLEEAPTEAPSSVQVHSTGAQSMKVTWMAPPEESQNGRIWGYYVGYRKAASSEAYNFVKVDVKEEAEQYSTYITGLKPFTLYDVVVRAFNSAGTGPKSPKETEKTLETAPPTSPTVKVISSSVSSIDISWDKDGRDKSAITDYTLHYKDEGETEWRQQKLNGPEDNFTLRGLKCGTGYSLYVTASNSLGTGEPSLPVNARTKGSAPMSPTEDVFITVNSTWAILHLNKWRSMDCAVVRFSVRLKQQDRLMYNSDKVDSSTDRFPLEHLKPGRDYIVFVTAHSEAGDTLKEYSFTTKMNSGSGSFPAYGKQETDQPFYLNVALVVPAVVSSLVLVIFAFALTICLRKHSYDRRRERECNSQKSYNDSLVMSDVAKRVPSSKESNKNSHYSIPGKNPEYAEPYTYKREDSSGLFATIKRCPTRPMCTSTTYKQGNTEVPPPMQAGGSSGQYKGGSSDQWNACAKSLG